MFEDSAAGRKRLRPNYKPEEGGVMTVSRTTLYIARDNKLRNLGSRNYGSMFHVK